MSAQARRQALMAPSSYARSIRSTHSESEGEGSASDGLAQEGRARFSWTEDAEDDDETASSRGWISEKAKDYDQAYVHGNDDGQASTKSMGLRVDSDDESHATPAR